MTFAVVAPPSNPASIFGNSSFALRDALLPLTNNISKSVVELESGFGTRSLGTVVSHGGYVIGKRSELSRHLFCKYLGQQFPALVVASHKDFDLALVKVEVNFQHPIEFKKEKASIQKGDFVVSKTRDLATPVIGSVAIDETIFDVN